VEAVRCAFDGEEEFSGSGGIELSRDLRSKRNPNIVVASVLCLFNPLSIRSPLDPICGPVVRVNSGFADVEFVAKPEGNCCMSSSTTISPDDHWVKSIKSGNTEEISRVNLASIDGNNFSSSPF